MVVIGPASELTDARAAAIARRRSTRRRTASSTSTRPSPEGERHIAAMAEAVQQSGLADRIGMSQSSQVVQMKTLDYFFSLRNVHQVAFQPIVELATGGSTSTSASSGRTCRCCPSRSARSSTPRSTPGARVELDALHRPAHPRRGRARSRPRARRAGEAVAPDRDQLHAGEPPRPAVRGQGARDDGRAAGLSPRQITVECTEQQAVPDVVPLEASGQGAPPLGFGFAVDDAGAGYASFALIAALRPSIIKIDRAIAAGIARDDAKQALVEAFVSFGRRIGARLLAEGIERRADLAMLSSLGVELGQGYLIGRPALEPNPPRPMAEMRPDRARAAVARRVRASVPAHRPRAAVAK